MKTTPCSKSAGLCISVLGSSGVGKTAITIRYLTGRYIGEYCSGSDMTYTHSVPLVGSLTTKVHIVDASRSDLKRFTGADARLNAFVIVYSTTDVRSLHEARQILAELPLAVPKILLANKTDLVHGQQVSLEDGERVAAEFRTCLHQVSAADDAVLIQSSFRSLIRQLISHAYMLSHPRIHLTLLSKLLALLVSKNKRGLAHIIDQDAVGSDHDDRLSPAKVQPAPRRTWASPILSGACVFRSSSSRTAKADQDFAKKSSCAMFRSKTKAQVTGSCPVESFPVKNLTSRQSSL